MKWSASQAVEQAETILRHRDIVGTPCEGGMGLVNNKQSKWKTAEPQYRRVMVQQEIRDMKGKSSPNGQTIVIVGSQCRAAVKALGRAAERASSWLWLKRDQENWKLSNER